MDSIASSGNFETIVGEPRRRRMILIATCTALMAVIASASGLNVAQQELALDIRASQSSVLWIINSYIVVLAALLLPAGAIADRWGRKPVLASGLVVFGLASAAAGFIESVDLMIGARILAGVGAAMVMPVTLSVITSSFPAEARTQAIGVWTAVAGGGGLLGMIVSALLVDVASWRWLFAVPVLLVVGAFVMGLLVIPNSRERDAASFDLAGSVLSIVAVGGLVLAIHEGPEHGWTEPLTVIALAAGTAALIGFVAWELRRRDPLLDIRMFRDRRLASGSTTLLLVFAVLAGVFVVLFPYFQAVLGWSAIRSTAGLLPMIVVMMLASGLAAEPVKRLGTGVTMTIGVGVAAVGLGLMAGLASVEGGYLSVIPGMVVIGLGMGLTMTPSTEAITSSLPPERQGVGSALNDTTRELGSALGIALLGAVLSAGYRDAIAPSLSAFPERIADAASEGIGLAFGVAAQQDDERQADALISAAQNAFVDGWVNSMWVGAAAMGALFLFLLFRGPRQPSAARTVVTVAKDDQPGAQADAVVGASSSSSE